MEEELKYTSKFNGEDTDSILEGAKKVINAELPSLDEIGGFMVYDKEGKAIGLMSSEQVAQVVGGLLPVADASKNGLMSKDFYKANASYVPSTNSGKLTHLFNLKQYAQGCFYLKFGDTANSYKISICIIDLNNRSQGSLLVISNKIAISERIPVNLYAKRNENNSIDVFVKQEVTTYPIVKFCWIHSPEDWNWTDVGTVSEVSESELTKIL